MSKVARSTVTIVNRLGLHARPAMDFVHCASRFDASITVRRGTQEVDGKSIMQLMLLAATCGTQLEVVAEGHDADEAIASIVELVGAGFNED